MPPPDFRWFSVFSRTDKLPDAIYRGMIEVLRPSQRIGHEVWWIEGVLTTVAGQGQSDLRIHRERQALLLAAEAVLQSPPTATCR